jgi:hypothetical protein
MTCIHLREFLDSEIKIIENHIDEHKWFNHIEDRNLAIEDFIVKYGWIMREYYCNYICPEGSGCLVKDHI